MKLVNCPTCGKRISSDMKICPDCNQSLENFKISNNSTNKISKVSMPKILLFILFVLIILSFIFASIIIIKTRNESDVENDASVSQVKKQKEADSNKSTKETSKDDIISYESEIYQTVTPVGVYDGNDHEKLIINSDGLAYYYCIDDEYSELACPWIYEDGKIEIELSKMHCTITAKVKDDDFSELTFKSSSLNWNTEVFEKINAEPREYLSRKILADDDNIIINIDGTMTLQISNFSFTIPKMFRSTTSTVSDLRNTTIIVDTDVDEYYGSTVLFYVEAYDENISSKKTSKIANQFAARFFINPKLELYSESMVNGIPLYVYSISGRLNEGFDGFAGYDIEGYIALYYDSSSESLIYVLFEQIPEKSIDDTEAFFDIINSIQTL